MSTNVRKNYVIRLAIGDEGQNRVENYCDAQIIKFVFWCVEERILVKLREKYQFARNKSSTSVFSRQLDDILNKCLRENFLPLRNHQFGS